MHSQMRSKLDTYSSMTTFQIQNEWIEFVETCIYDRVRGFTQVKNLIETVRHIRGNDTCPYMTTFSIQNERIEFVENAHVYDRVRRCTQVKN